VFNNAGTGVMGENHLLEKGDWDLQIDINVGGLVNVVRAVYPRLVAQGFGHLVNTASMAGLVGSPFLSVYVATKHFVVGLSKSMRIEGSRHGVRVSALCPGAVRTPLLTGGSIGRTIYEMSDERKLAWWERFRPGDAGVFAKQTLDAVAKNGAIIVLPKHNRAVVALFRTFPWLEEKIAKKIYDKTLVEYPEMATVKAKAVSAAAGLRVERDAVS
jgi:short-subunit dehydrogenase